MSLWIATGADHPYLAKAQPYLDSLKRHEPHRATFFAVDFAPGQDVGMNLALVDFSRCIPCSKKMLQVGSFVLFAPSAWDLDDVVIFTDGDAIAQRPLSPEEIDLFTEKTRDGGVMIGRNNPDPTQTLAQESRNLFPMVREAEISRRFPGYENYLARNTGFIIARLATWWRIYTRVASIWPVVASTWSHYASAQMAVSWVVQKYPEFKLHDLTLSVHSHGHLGAPPGITYDADGTCRADGKVVYFRHAL